jgi:hypothetical protein
LFVVIFTSQEPGTDVLALRGFAVLRGAGCDHRRLLTGLPPCPFGIIVLSVFLVARILDLKQKPR